MSDIPEEIFLSQNPLNKDGFCVYFNGGQIKYIRADLVPDHTGEANEMVKQEALTRIERLGQECDRKAEALEALEAIEYNALQMPDKDFDGCVEKIRKALESSQ